MTWFLHLALALAWFAIVLVGWLGWQLLRQNGRLLLRLDELEKRLVELEFGEGEEPRGLPVGTEAPAFELADLAGGRQSLARFRSRPVLLIFFNPDCGFCRELMPKLAGLYGVRRQAERDAALDAEANVVHPSQSAVTAGAVQNNGGSSLGEHPRVLLITNGDAEKNRQFFAEHKVSCPVLLQNDGEVAKAYQVNGTPAGYFISTEGKIASELAIGAEALLELASQPAPLTPTLSPSDGERENGGGDGRADRFGSHALVRSKIKRDGLKAGTPAPDFRLPRLDGRGELSLSELRGRRVLLVFSDPHCGPCNTLSPELEKFYRENRHTDMVVGTRRGTTNRPLTPSLSPSEGEKVSEGRVRGTRPITVIMISRGVPKENHAKVREHGLTFPVVLQQQWEISRRYAMFATPIAYLIDEAGNIVQDVAVGVEPILALLASADHQRSETALDEFRAKPA